MCKKHSVVDEWNEVQHLLVSIVMFLHLKL